MPAQAFAELVLGIPIDKLRNFIALSAGRWWWGLPIWYLRSAKLSFEGRLVALLGELSRKFGIRDSKGVIINIPLTHTDLAELLGSSRPTVTIEMNRLEAEGSITRSNRRFIIKDTLLKRLDEMVELPRKLVEAETGP
jgi:CRP-like cAMP-binding protein